MGNEFDAIATNYAGELNRALSVTGDSVDFYAEQRMLHLSRRLNELDFKPSKVLDFGCGTGTATPYFFQHLSANSVLGVDVSVESLRVASSKFGGIASAFTELGKFKPQGDLDLAFCNGVFHHIVPAERAGALQTVRRALRGEGLFAFWENNPWNPGTQWVMSRTPFDHDAIKISPFEAKQLLRSAGFRVLRCDSLFYFPRTLRWFRPLEKLLVGVPLGGQYLMLCIKERD